MDQEKSQSLELKGNKQIQRVKEQKQKEDYPKQIYQNNPKLKTLQNIVESQKDNFSKSTQIFEFYKSPGREEKSGQYQTQLRQSLNSFNLASEDIPHPKSLDQKNSAQVIQIYENVYNNYQNALQERNKLEKHLRNEILNSEQQRVKLELLQQALEEQVKEGPNQSIKSEKDSCEQAILKNAKGEMTNEFNKT